MQAIKCEHEPSGPRTWADFISLGVVVGDGAVGKASRTLTAGVSDDD